MEEQQQARRHAQSMPGLDKINTKARSRQLRDIVQRAASKVEAQNPGYVPSRPTTSAGWTQALQWAEHQRQAISPASKRLQKAGRRIIQMSRDASAGVLRALSPTRSHGRTSPEDWPLDQYDWAARERDGAERGTAGDRSIESGLSRRAHQSSASEILFINNGEDVVRRPSYRAGGHGGSLASEEEASPDWHRNATSDDWLLGGASSAEAAPGWSPTRTHGERGEGANHAGWGPRSRQIGMGATREISGGSCNSPTRGSSQRLQRPATSHPTSGTSPPRVTVERRLPSAHLPQLGRVPLTTTQLTRMYKRSPIKCAGTVRADTQEKRPATAGAGASLVTRRSALEQALGNIARLGSES